MSSQSGYHTTEDDNEESAKSPPRHHQNAAAATEQQNDTSVLWAQLHDLTVTSQGEIAYWKAQVEQSKQDMVEILGHAENLSKACEELEDEVADLKADNVRLKSLAESRANSSPGKISKHAVSGDVRSRLANALAGEGGDPSFLDLLAKGGVAQQLSTVAQRLRGEQRTEEGTANEEADEVSQYAAEQLGLLGTLLEGAAREMLEQATELATEKEAHDVTASRLALLQKKYAVEEMKNSVRGGVSRRPAGSPVGSGSPGTPRSGSRPSRRPRSAQRQVPLSPNGSNWDETLRESTLADTDTAAAVTIDHSRRNSIGAGRRVSTSNGRRRPTAYISAAPSPVRRRERADHRSISRPRAGSPPPQHSAYETTNGNRSSRSTSASRKRHGSRGSTMERRVATAALGYRRTTAASLSHEPASVSQNL